MNFVQFNKLIQEQFEKMCQHNLFISEISGQQIWETYLNSFLVKELFRVNQVNDGNYDKSFIRKYGNIVSIIDNKLVSLWDVEVPESCEFYNPVIKVRELIHSKNIEGVFIETFANLNESPYESCRKTQEKLQLGMSPTHMMYKENFVNERDNPHGKIPGKVYTFNHFNMSLPKRFVDMTNKSKEAIVGDLNTTRQVFQKGLNIPLDTLKLVRDLIEQGSLLRGDMYLSKVKEFITLKEKYDKVPNKELWVWDNFQKVPFARFANELIGTTCIELAEGKEINKVCKDFNVRVDPTNYNKAKAPITPQMIAIAEREILNLGYQHSFDRRFATLEDINVSEIRHVNNDKEKPLGLFGQAGVKGEVNRHKRAEFDKVETITIQKFMETILPTVESMEVFVENKHESNLVSLFTAQDNLVKNLFKWNNLFSWTYNGNLSGKSMIKEAVSSRGGKTDVKVRVSIHFPDTTDDYDLHCFEPNRNHIYYSNRKIVHTSSGMLDLDAQGVDGHQSPEKRVENLTYSDLSKMQRGKYNLAVYNFSNRGVHTKFNLEVEIDGDVTLLQFDKTSKEDEMRSIGFLEFDGKTVSYTPENCKILESKTISKTLWNLDTNNFHKVNLVCESPNYWGDNNIGTKEYFFMLQDCKTPNATRAFHVDQLNSELMGIRKAIDLLGNYKMVEPADKQLSGLGFNSTVRDEIIVRVSGSHKRVLKIQF